MSAFSPYLFFLLFFILLVTLWWLSWRIGLLIQEIVYQITGSDNLAMVILFLIYLPGILIHEASHWLTARILGLKTSKISGMAQVYSKYHWSGERDGCVRRHVVGQPCGVGAAADRVGADRTHR